MPRPLSRSLRPVCDPSGMRTSTAPSGRVARTAAPSAALHAIAVVRLEVNLEVEVAGRALARAGPSLAGEADHLAFVDALRDAHVEAALVEAHPPLRVDLRHAERHAPRRAPIRVLERKQDLRVMILAAHVHARAAHAAAAEELGEEVAEIGGLALEGAAPRELEARVPVGRRLEFLPGATPARELVVGGALLGVREDRVRLVHFLHPRLGVRLLRDVRMVLAREASIRLLDLVLRRLARDAERLVVVAEFH